jgi:GT2 family glycosyltransferase
VIAFGCSIIKPEIYTRHAKVGLERASEPDSAVYAFAAAGSVARSYNLMFDTAARADELEALVLVHEDAEIVDPHFCEKLRAAFADPNVAVVGCVGAGAVSDLAWWDGAVTWNSLSYHYDELGGGELRWRPALPQAPGPVDSIYGVIMAFSPWAVRTLGFDESIGMLHGYDADICRQARAAGRTVLAADLEVAHHHSLDLVEEIEIWVSAHMRAAELWDSQGPDDPNGSEWKARARRAEAAAAATRLLAASELLRVDATARLYAREQEQIERSRSWRMTAPLRRGNALRKATRERLAARRRRSG